MLFTSANFLLLLPISWRRCIVVQEVLLLNIKPFRRFRRQVAENVFVRSKSLCGGSHRGESSLLSSMPLELSGNSQSFNWRGQLPLHILNNHCVVYCLKFTETFIFRCIEPFLKVTCIQNFLLRSGTALRRTHRRS